MTWIVLSAAIALAFVVTVCCAAVVELFRQIADIRRALNLEDTPTPIGLQPNMRLHDLAVPTKLVSAPTAIVVFLSQKCTTCLAIADAFRGGAPESVWFVISTPPNPPALLDTLGASAERVILDIDDMIAQQIGLRVTPAVLTTSFGEITRADAVSTPRQVMALIPSVFPADGGAISKLAFGLGAYSQTTERRQAH